jgi:hypothetical protein
MTTLVELLTYMIASAGITNIVVYGSIFDRIRPKKGWFGKLFNCPMCLGTWVGFALCGLAGWTELFNIEPTLMNYALCGAISSFSAYAFAMMIDDKGIRISNMIGTDEENRGCADCNGERLGSLEQIMYMHMTNEEIHQGGGDDQQ